MNIHKLLYSWQQLDQDTVKLALSVARSGWLPDYIVGISRGGCVPAVSLSHALGVPMKPLQVTLTDGDENDCVSDRGMAEDAFGYVPEEQAGDYFATEYDIWHPKAAKNILVVDDINDTGKTFKWIQQNWPSLCMPTHERWKSVWHQNVRFAVLHNNESSRFKKTDYAANWINKREQDCWIVYPWEALGPA
jgi:hypoxanthine phosphoribosyltransferase